MNIKQTIIAEMKAQGLSTAELTRRSGLGVGTLYEWFGGNRNRGITVKTLGLVMDVLGLEIRKK